MDKRLFDVFNKVHAEDELKQKTTQYLYSRIAVQKVHKKFHPFVLAAACASLSLFLLGSIFYTKMYFSPVAYIDIDVNPSIELVINKFGSVIRSSGYNSDGNQVLDKINIRHENYSKALDKVLDSMGKSGYFKEDKLLSVTIQTNKRNKENTLLKALQTAINTSSEKHRYNIESDVYAVTEKVKHCASEQQVSPAKYLAIQDLLAVDSKADIEKCKEHSISELKDMTKKCEEHHSTQDNAENSGNNSGHGSGSGNHHH